MIVLSVLGGIGALAVGLIIAELRGKGRPRHDINDRALAIDESNVSRVGEYFPLPDDGRPQK
jgi:hypothetical protein